MATRAIFVPAESHWCASSQGPSSAVGGVMTLISRKWLDGCIPVATPVVEGRVIRTEIRRDGALERAQDFGQRQMKEIETMVQCDVTEAETDPTRRSVVLAGDWNFCPTDEPGFDLKNAVGNLRPGLEEDSVAVHGHSR